MSTSRFRSSVWAGLLGSLILAAAVAAQAGEPRPGFLPGELLPDEGADHLPPGSRGSYRTDPPTSGPHSRSPARAGFYTKAPPVEEIVHILEHGNIVIYYNPATVRGADLQKLKALAERFPGFWDGVLVVPRQDRQYPVIATAWRRWLRLKRFDEATLEQFVDAFRGRGPENPVR